MLTIRMQRLGRKGHPTYRVVVQDVRQTPTSGKYVALLGSYDPHSKTTTVSKEKAEFYLTHGAQPSDRVVRLFKDEGIKLPKWVKQPVKQAREIRNPEKLRRNRPAEEAAPAEEPVAEAQEPSADETAAESQAEETVAEATTEEASETAEAPAEEAIETADASTEDTPAAEEETAATEETEESSEENKA